MEAQVTLTILGRPLTFSSRVEACRTIKVGNRFKPGPCPKNLPGNSAGKPRVAPKKAAGKGPDPSRSLSERDKAVGQRHAEVEKILKKKDHKGLPTSEIPKVLTTLGERNGWSKPNLGAMSIKYRGKHGDAEIRLHPQGWQVIAPNNPEKGYHSENFVVPDLNEARAIAERNAGPRRMRQPAKTA